MDTQAPPQVTQPVPVAFLGRTSTMALQDPTLSLPRQLRECDAKLPPGWFIAAHYWDIESGGADLEERGHGTAHELVDVGIPRDGGIAALLDEASSPAPRFAAVVCEDIERSGRDTFNALKLEKQLAAAGILLFATDEPIDIAGMNATTILIRRVKQGVAEWLRLQIKEKAWRGLREHTIQGWNIGAPPYGYLAHRTPHPVAAKAAEGRTKSRLILDPDRAPVVEQIFAWRVTDKLGMPTIAARLNADPGQYPPPKGAIWTVPSVYTILGNPKYTGHMVWNRNTKTGGRKRANPPQAWIWSAKETHPDIITRDTWDTAQTIAAAHATSRDGNAPSSHPQTRRSYPLRSRIRCKVCRRRMAGSTRHDRTYYICPHNMSDPRHAAAVPDHPKFVTIREDTLITVLDGILTRHVFGPERAALLAATTPATPAAQAEEHAARIAALTTRIHRIDAAQNALIRELETPPQPGDPTAGALRDRIRARFAELETERHHLDTQATALSKAARHADDPALLDDLPSLPSRLPDLPAHLQAALYQALDIELLYNRPTHQVTIFVTITGSTPQAILDIIHATQAPSSLDTASSRSDLPRSTPAGRMYTAKLILRQL